MEMPPGPSLGHFSDNPDPGEVVDARSDKLINEFREHWQELNARRQEGNKVDRSGAFEGWALQKIAGLQVVVEDLLSRIDALEAQHRD